MFPLGIGQVAQHLRADRFGVTLGQCKIGMISLHFGLPVLFEGGQNLLHFGGAHGYRGHAFLLTFSYEDTAFPPMPAGYRVIGGRQ